jgi:nucleoside-diphosphate-sugar epimerase
VTLQDEYAIPRWGSGVAIGPIRITRRRVKVAAKILLDAALAAVAFLVATELRFAGTVPSWIGHDLFWILALVVVGKTLITGLLGGHSRIWHYTSAQEAVLLALGAGLSSGLLMAASATGALPVPLSLLLIDGPLYLLGVFAVRILRRMQVTMVKKRQDGDAGPDHVRTLLIGAGDTANALLADIESRNHTNWDIVGLLDDDPAKRRARLRGVPVLGPTTRLEHYIQELGIRHVVMAMPSAQRAVIRGVITRAQACGATVQAVPALEDLLRKGVPVGGALPITLADLQDSAEVRRTLLSSVRRSDSNERVLVTGGAGYIGCHVVSQLLELGYRVRVLDNFTFGRESLAGVLHHPSLEVVKGDISSIRDVVAAVKDSDHVVALAAIVGDPACGLNAEETLNLNYESTKVLTEACNFYGVQRLVFASSCSVYGASENHFLTESSPLNPVSLYARTRIMSEEIVFNRAGDVVPVVLRLATVFGLSPRMRYDLVVNLMTAHALVGRRIQIFGGDQWRPFVHCRDAARAFVTAISAPDTVVRGRIFNVGSNGMNSTIRAVGDLVVEEVGGDVSVDAQPNVDDPRNYRVRFDLIEDALGFRPEYDMRRGIREMIEAIEGTPTLRDYDRAAYSNLKFLKDRFESAGVAAGIPVGSP